MQIENIKIENIKPYEKNAKKHPKEQIEQIKNSIKKFGMNDPIGIWGEKNIIVEGHGRLIACKELGFEEVPCIRLDHLSDKERKAYTLAHNQTTLTSDFDIEILSEEIESLIDDFNMEDFGFDLDELNIGIDEIIEDDFDCTPPEEPKAKLGDIYQLGKNRLMCGDSTKEEDVAKLMNEEIADISFTSPPYNAGSQQCYGSNESKYENDNDNKTEEEYRAFLNKYLNCAISFSQYVFCNIQSLAGNKIALIDFLYDNKNLYADTMIWDKQHGQPAMGRNVLNSAFEYIHIFSKKAKRSIGVKDFRGTIDNVLRMSSQRGNEYAKIHNATFSVAFASFFVQNFSIQSVLDLFGGTGTTLIACEQLNRNCYMMELDPKYVQVIIQRYIAFKGTSDDVYRINADGTKTKYEEITNE
ncbi:MAG: site-specific DNA-methyltransferase [Clostridia bacterium]|nr:site-specific DNA-methyltransferase [Clostridia bacterium]